MSAPAPAACSVSDENEKEFTHWLSEVSQRCIAKWGLALEDLPDLPTRSAFDAGVTPDEFFRDEVVALVREDFAELVPEED